MSCICFPLNKPQPLGIGGQHGVQLRCLNHKSRRIGKVHVYICARRQVDMKQVNPLRTKFIELNITTKKYAYVSKWYNLEKKISVCISVQN